LVTLGEESFAVDRDLNVLAKINDSGVSRIRLISRDVSRCVVGEKLSFFDPTIGDSVLQFIQTLESEEMIGQVSEIDLQDKFYIRIRYLDRFDVILGENSDLPYKFAMLRGVVADLYPEAKGEIDVTDPNTAYVRLNHE